VTALLQRRGAPATAWLLALAVLCAGFGLAAGISPKYSIAGVLGLAFVVAVFADLAVGVGLFALLSFLSVINIGGAAVSFDKAAGLLLFMSWIANRTTAHRQNARAVIARHPAMLISIVAFVGWSIVSAVWAENSGDALVTAYRDVLDLLLIPIVYSAVRSRRDVYVIVAGYLAGAAFSAIYGLLVPPAATSAAAGRLTGSLGEANQQATVLVAAIALSMGIALAARHSRALKILAVGATAASFVGLVTTLSRAGLLAFVVVLIAGMVVGGRWRRRAAVMVIVGAASLVGYYATLAPSTAYSRITSADTSGRNDIWTVGWRMFEAHPLNGVGAGNFPVSSVHYLQRPGLVTSALYIVDVPKVAHNIYLEQLATIGVPGLLAMLGIFIAGIAAALRAAHIFERLGDVELELLSRCAILGLFAFLAADFFASELLSKQLWLVFALGPALLKLARIELQNRGG
jgi:O-antigen ligase